MKEATPASTSPQLLPPMKNHLANGARSSVLTEDATNWILTTVWPGDC